MTEKLLISNIARKMTDEYSEIARQKRIEKAKYLVKMFYIPAIERAIKEGKSSLEYRRMLLNLGDIAKELKELGFKVVENDHRSLTISW